jgi:hypothetical protein
MVSQPIASGPRHGQERHIADKFAGAPAGAIGLLEVAASAY